MENNEEHKNHSKNEFLTNIRYTPYHQLTNDLPTFFGDL
jgi:hypothetical protein